MKNSTNINHHANLPIAISNLVDVHKEIFDKGVTVSLANLIMLRVSQVNQCSFCVIMHSNDARKAGETSERLDKLCVFEFVDDFTDAEKSALRWALALTSPDDHSKIPLLREDLRLHYSDETISALTLLIGMINLWNRVGISNH